MLYYNILWFIVGIVSAFVWWYFEVRPKKILKGSDIFQMLVLLFGGFVSAFALSLNISIMGFVKILSITIWEKNMNGMGKNRYRLYELAKIVGDNKTIEKLNEVKCWSRHFEKIHPLDMELLEEAFQWGHTGQLEYFKTLDNNIYKYLQGDVSRENR